METIYKSFLMNHRNSPYMETLDVKWTWYFMLRNLHNFLPNFKIKFLQKMHKFLPNLHKFLPNLYKFLPKKHKFWPIYIISYWLRHNFLPTKIKIIKLVGIYAQFGRNLCKFGRKKKLVKIYLNLVGIYAFLVGIYV